MALGVLSPTVTKTRSAGVVAWTSSTYFAEGLPWTILHQVAAEFFTALGLPATQVGYTSVLHLSTSLKFVWSPLVDLFGTLRRWMVTTQAVLGGLLGILALLAHDLASRGGIPDTTLVWIVLVMIGIASATHDIACDGYYMDALDKQAQARHAGVRVAAFRAAMLVGNAGLVYLGGRFGWLWGFGLAAVWMLSLAVAHHWLLPHHRGHRPATPAPGQTAQSLRFAQIRASYASFLTQDRAVVVVLFLLTYKLGDALMFNMSKVLLRDLGITTAERGVINGFGTAASIVGAIVGGWWIARKGLAAAIVPITLLMAATQPLYLLLAAPTLPAGLLAAAEVPTSVLTTFTPSLAWVGLVLVIEQICGGMAVAAQMVFLMRRCHPDHKAAHFAFGTAIYALAQTATGTYSGWVYQGHGPLFYFAIASVACIPCLMLVTQIPTDDDRSR